MKYLLLTLLIVISNTLSAQTKDSISLNVKYGAKSSEFQEFLSFKQIDFYKIKIQDKNLKGKSFILVAKEYWNKKLSNIDTILDLSKSRRPQLEKDSLNISVLTEKSEMDSLKINFRFKGLLGVTKKYKTTDSDKYSTRDLSNGKNTIVTSGDYFPVLVYSLPYEDPNYPGFLLYCELTREGIPTEKWGEKFNIKHYIVFEMKIE